MKEVKVREAKAGDAKLLAELAGELGYPAKPEAMRLRLKSIARDPDHAAFVAEKSDSKVVGWAHAFITHSLLVEPFVELGGLVVSSAHQRLGIGQLLMKAVEGWARKKKISSVRVRSRSTRKPAHAFYRIIGYQQLKTQETFVKEIGKYRL